jgi:hypothetical protein
MLISQKEMGNRKDMQLPTPVVIRAYGGEPVVMEAVSVGPRFATVRRPEGGETTVRLSYESVYEFEPSQYGKLVKAFTRGDRETLERLWRVTPTIG